MAERIAMEYDFYTLGVLYLVYSFAGWVGETVVATVRGKHFANRGALLKNVDDIFYLFYKIGYIYKILLTT